MSLLVVGSIQELGLEVEHIPSECISLCQPVDVGIIRSSKAVICKDWRDCMLDSGISISVTKPLTRTLIIEWVMGAYNSISVEVVKNC